MTPLKATSALIAGSLLLTTFAAQADFTLHGEAGEHYTNLAFATNQAAPGMTVNGNWAHSDNDGDIAGLGLGLNLKLGPFLVTMGGKGLYLNPKDGDEGYAVAVGGGAQLPLGDRVTFFGESYYSPDSLSSGVEDYVEANAGMRVRVIQSMEVEAGYRYMDMAGKHSHRDNVVADGAYAAIRYTF